MPLRFGEAQFWLSYRKLLFAYRRQFTASVSFTEAATEGLSKLSRSAAKQLSVDSWHAAVETLTQKLADKKIRPKTAADYRYLIALNAAGADFAAAIRNEQALFRSGFAGYGDSLDQVDHFTAAMQWNNALDLNEHLAQTHPNDTLLLAEISRQRSDIYSAQLDSAQALSQLIEAEYLLQRIVPDAQSRRLHVKVLLDMAVLQNKANDFQGALANAKKAQGITESSDSFGRALGFMVAGVIYQKAGAPKEAEETLRAAYELFSAYTNGHREEAAPAFAELIDAYALAVKWFDRDKLYEELLLEATALRAQLSVYGLPYFRFECAHTLFTLGQKYMNVDVKIGPAEKAWTEAGALLEPLIKENVVLAGDLACDNYYKLAGCKSAFKKTAEAKEIFRKSLLVREKLYAIAPGAYARDLATVQIQNANFDAQDKDFEGAIRRLDVAEQKARETGDKHMIGEINNFRDYLKEKINK
ncbi:MAG: hypothetical protein QM743_09825 [Chitinophagaceae bacterium]